MLEEGYADITKYPYVSGAHCVLFSVNIMSIRKWVLGAPILVFLWVSEARNSKMFRRFGGALEHLTATCFGHQKEHHVIEKHSLQHELKQSDRAAASWDNLIRRAYLVVSTQINIKKNNLNYIQTLLKSHRGRSDAAPIRSTFYFSCGATAPLGPKFRNHSR